MWLVFVAYIYFTYTLHIKQRWKKRMRKTKKEKSLSVSYTLFLVVFPDFYFYFYYSFFSQKFSSPPKCCMENFLFFLLFNLRCNACNIKVTVLGKFIFFSDFHRWYGKLIFILYFVEIDCMENIKVYWKSRFLFIFKYIFLFLWNMWLFFR